MSGGSCSRDRLRLLCCERSFLYLCYSRKMSPDLYGIPSLRSVYLRLFFFAFPPPPCCWMTGLDIVTGAATVAGAAAAEGWAGADPAVADPVEDSCVGALLCILAIRERFRRSNLFKSCI